MKIKTIVTALCISMLLSNTAWSMETSEEESEPSCNIFDTCCAFWALTLEHHHPRHHLDNVPIHTEETDCNDYRNSQTSKPLVPATPKKTIKRWMINP